MKLLSFASWPFRPMQVRSLEEQDRWWKYCYLPGTADRILQGGGHWRILAGGAGGGKSATILSLEKHAEATSLIVRYRPERWPGAMYARRGDENHLAQIMASAGLAIRDHLTAHPEKIAALSDIQREFVRWLLEKFDRPRAFTRWLDGLDPELAKTFHGVAYKDIYPTTTDPLDAQGQIDELAALTRKLGYQRVLVTVDLDQFEARKHLDNLNNLFTWLNLMHHPGLSLVAAVPRDVVAEAQLLEQARGRVSVVYLNWELNQVREIALRHVWQAVDNSGVGWEDLLAAKVQAAMEALLLNEYGDYAPASWVALAETILYLATQAPSRMLPLQEDDLSDIQYNLFDRHLPLRLDPDGRGVWRGPKYIPLTEQPFRFLQALYQRGGRPRPSDEDLIAIAGSRGNIHSLASRARSLIEPLPDNSIYLMNRRSEGYWLENCA